MNIDQQPKCPVCGQTPEEKIRKYIPAGTNTVTGIFYCCFTVFPFPPVNPPSEDDGGHSASRRISVNGVARPPAKALHAVGLTDKGICFLSLIKQGLAKCCQKKLLPITRFDIQFDLTSGPVPHLKVTLDSHAAGDPQSKTLEKHLVVDKTIREWVAPCDATVSGENVTVITTTGEHEVNDEASLYEVVGQFFIELVTERDSGCLKQLPRGAACYLGVNAFDGSFGWPGIDDRGPATCFKLCHRTSLLDLSRAVPATSCESFPITKSFGSWRGDL